MANKHMKRMEQLNEGDAVVHAFSWALFRQLTVCIRADTPPRKADSSLCVGEISLQQLYTLEHLVSNHSVCGLTTNTPESQFQETSFSSQISGAVLPMYLESELLGKISLLV